MTKLGRGIATFLGFKQTSEGKIRRIHPPHNPLSKARHILSNELTRRVPWKHDDLDLAKLNSSRYYKVWKRLEGGHKKYSYFALYDKLFTGFIGKSPRVLEIGVYKGASIKAWREFLGDGATIVGVDIDQNCEQYEDADKGIFVRIGSQADLRFLKRVTDEFGPFDIILDDGSHLTHDVIATFNFAFAYSLKQGGIYFIEDLNTSYWRRYRTSRYSAMDMVLSLCEMTHQFYFEHRPSEFKREAQREFSIPEICTLIEEVRVFDSAAAVHKGCRPPPLVFHT